MPKLFKFSVKMDADRKLNDCLVSAMIILAEEGQDQRIRNAIAMHGGGNDRYG
jgi:hypothetical protein